MWNVFIHSALDFFLETQTDIFIIIIKNIMIICKNSNIFAFFVPKMVLLEEFSLNYFFITKLQFNFTNITSSHSMTHNEHDSDKDILKK